MHWATYRLSTYPIEKANIMLLDRRLMRDDDSNLAGSPWYAHIVLSLMRRRLMEDPSEWSIPRYGYSGLWRRLWQTLSRKKAPTNARITSYVKRLPLFLHRSQSSSVVWGSTNVWRWTESSSPNLMFATDRPACEFGELDLQSERWQPAADETEAKGSHDAQVCTIES